MTGRSGSIDRLARLSVAVALAVLALKLTGSVALFSDALESIVNVATAFLALWAVRVSQRPPDAEHHYGHHKIEYIVAVVEGVLIVVAALLIFREAWEALRAPQPIAAPAAGIAVSALAAAVNGFWARHLGAAARAARSPVLEADARHIMADVVTTGGVLAGLGVALATGWHWADPLLAVIVACNILWEGYKVISTSLGGLMDQAVSAYERRRIEAVILDHAAGAIEAHDIRTRRAGPVTFIDFHLIVDSGMTVEDSHLICDRLEAGLAQAVPGAKVAIHVEPGHKARPDASVPVRRRG